MSPAELASLDKILANARGSIALRAMAQAAGVDYAEAERVARKIAAEGMTLEQARAFAAATDTPEERNNILALLDGIDRDGNRADEYAVLQWAWHEAYGVINATPAPPPTILGTAGDFQFRLGLPLFTYSWWTLRQQIPRILAEVALECAKLGIPRGDLVFPMETHSDGGRPGAPVQSWKDHYRERIAAHPGVVNQIGAAGFGSLIIPWNENTQEKGYAKSWNGHDMAGNVSFIKPLISDALRAIRWDRCLAAMCNEGYKTDIDKSLRQIPVDLRIPGEKLVYSDEPRMGARWHDIHFKDVNSLPSLGGSDIAMSDNGGSIRQLYGTSDIWNGKVSINVDAHLKCLNRYVANGGRIWFYGLTLSDIWTPYVAEWRQILAHYARMRGYSSAGQPQPSSVVFSHLRGTYVKWTGCDRSGWPVIDNGKTCNGLLYGCLVGGTPKKIEWIPVGRENTGWQNAVAGPGSKYGQSGWVKGARVLFQIRDIHGVLRNASYQGEFTLP